MTLDLSEIGIIPMSERLTGLIWNLSLQQEIGHGGRHSDCGFLQTGEHTLKRPEEK